MKINGVVTGVVEIDKPWVPHLAVRISGCVAGKDPEFSDAVTVAIEIPSTRTNAKAFHVGRAVTVEVKPR